MIAMCLSSSSCRDLFHERLLGCCRCTARFFLNLTHHNVPIDCLVLMRLPTKGDRRESG